MKITLICKQCGTAFEEKPSHHWRKYCSVVCYGEAKTAERYALKPCPECGIMKKTRQDREATRCAGQCAGKAVGERCKVVGHNPHQFETPESRSRRLASLGSDEHRDFLSATKKGVPQKTVRTKRNSPDHARAITGLLRSPRNTTHRYKNLSKFIQENPGLFDPEDVKPRPWRDKVGYRSRALTGLLSIINGRRGTWKGWTVVSFTETFYNRGANLLSGERRQPSV